MYAIEDHLLVTSGKGARQDDGRVGQKVGQTTDAIGSSIAAFTRALAV